MASFSELVLVGRVVKPQGRHGEVAVEAISDRPSRFPQLRRAYVAGEGGQPRELRITRSWPHKGRYVVKVEGIDSIDAAETLRGKELRIPEQELEALPEGSYYYHQLTGMRVEDASGRPLGVVEDVLETGPEARVLVVRGDGEELLLPFADAFVQQVDLPGRRLVVRPPEFADAH
jgi:16S rRNA processing protein RimM